MNITPKNWIIFIILACFSAVLWFLFSYPQLSFINLSIQRTDAINIASSYLKNQGVNPSEYKTTAVFRFDRSANQYLQKNIGITELRSFVKKYDYDMFYWSVRFFKEQQKKSYRITISSKTGEVIAYSYTIDENEKAPAIDKEETQAKATDFLQQRFNTNFDNFKLAQDAKKSLEFRDDFIFAWENNTVSIPWTDDPDATTAKLVRNIRLNSNEIISFNKYYLQIPDGFKRFLKKQHDIGANLMSIIHILNIGLIGMAVFFVTKRRNHLAMFHSKKFYIIVTAVIFTLLVLSFFNQYLDIINSYRTSQDFESYLFRVFTDFITGAFIISIMIIMPSLAGESLHYQNADAKKERSFLYFLRTSFLTRDVSCMILFGYLICIISLGLQSTIIRIGQHHWGVWVEHSWMNNLSTAYLPFIAALTVSIKAAFSEELMFRLFSINWLKMLCKNTAIAVLISSVIWGFSHSNYPVYPMWFRGVEVTLLGVFLGFVYLRFGLITVIVSHYVFDAFWLSAGYLFGTSTPFNFYSSAIICLLPLVFAIIAYACNHRPQIKPLQWKLNIHQKFNMQVLKEHLHTHWNDYKHREDKEIVNTIIDHGWDMSVIEEALREIRKERQ